MAIMVTMLNSGVIAIFGSMALSSAVAAEITDGDLVLAPSTPWKVDYAAKECRLLRTFGTGDEAITLRLARGSGFDSFDMVVAGVSIPKLPKELPVNMHLSPQGTEASFDGYSLDIPDRPERFIRWFDGKPEILDAVTNDQIVHVTGAAKFDIAMRWTDGKAALAALKTCHDDLLTGWGVDLAKVRSATTQPTPVGSPGRWATNDDYPAKALRAEQEGAVAFLLTIASTGEVADCRIVSPSGVSELDEKTCQIVRPRAKFTPALDGSGLPTVGYYINRIRWQIPR